MLVPWSSRLGRSLVLLCLISVTGLLYLAFGSSPTTPEVILFQSGAHTFWPGWSGIRHVVALGDSYTSTGFDYKLAQPSPENPFGNPPLPGKTSSLGPNWIEYLTTKYNQSYIETVNLAYGGATLDYYLVLPHVEHVKSVKFQIERQFTPTYATHPPSFPWKSDNTLFTVWVGINDIGNAAAENEPVFEKIFDEYPVLVDELYASGARNFLLLTVPPFYRSPKIRDLFPEQEPMLRSRVAGWNRNVTSMASGFRRRHQDATVFVFDTHDFWNLVLDDFCSYPETCAYKSDSFCFGYLVGQAEDMNANHPDCEFPLSEYVWFDDLHPTPAIHDLTARLIAESFV